jgi:hypothetical protein
LLDTHDEAEWTPPSDIREILNSEYTALQKELDAEDQQGKAVAAA